MATSKIELMRPDGLHKNPAYSQLAIIEGNNRTIYIGGQNAVNKDGNIVGKDDMEAQAKQVLHNLETALQAVVALSGTSSNGMSTCCRDSRPKKHLRYFRPR